ncbi:VOC family protein [Halovivax gelatinilyticus]|uniref:VOC family protein n=1 Tax=Halovivax gelatinilyticus TaxID=2961597 RepID=UPI0020CA3F09|nr:VOC family protein [Halovivax gelatinilyticus]
MSVTLVRVASFFAIEFVAPIMFESEPDLDLRVRVDHVGIAVDDRETVATVLKLLGGDLIADEPADGFRWVQYELGDLSRIELIEPTADDTFLTEFLERNGPGLHHITFEVASIDDVVSHLDSHDVRVVDRADHEKYREAFLSPRSTGGILFQLMEYEPGYCDVYGEPGVGDDLLVDHSYVE